MKVRSRFIYKGECRHEFTLDVNLIPLEGRIISRPSGPRAAFFGISPNKGQRYHLKSVKAVNHSDSADARPEDYIAEYGIHGRDPAFELNP